MAIYRENTEIPLIFDDFADEFAGNSLRLRGKPVNQGGIA
jgi:hypothetical protein